MPSSNKSSLAKKVFHFNVKNHVAGYFLIANMHRLPVEEDFESNTDVLHFLGNGVSPKGVAIPVVNFKCILDGLRHFNAKFVGLFKESWIMLLHKQDNPIPLFKIMRDPPVESWFMVNTNDLGVFGGLNGVGFLKVRSLRFSQDKEPSFNWQHICQPMVKRFR